MDDQGVLGSDPAGAVLARLRGAARRDWLRFPSFLPALVTGLARGTSLPESLTPEVTKDCYIPVSREQGEFLYLTARALGARHVVEFGTSFGISTISLAAAVRDNGAGVVIGSEIEPAKCAAARRHLDEAGLSEFSEVREGDALDTLSTVPGPVDLVLLDGAKELYLPILQLLRPRLGSRAVVLADNIHTFRRSLRPYVDFVQSGENGFVSTTLSMGHGFEYSVYVGSA